MEVILDRKAIIKDLEDKVVFNTCPFYIKSALALIRELTLENERLHASCTELTHKCASLQDDVAKEFTCVFGTPHKVSDCPIDDEIAKAKADTVRKIFAEIDKFGKRPIPEASPVYILKQSDLDEIRNKHIPRGTPQDTCISCGEVIPEGRQICHSCEVRDND